VNQVTDFMNTGVLTPEEAQPLLDAGWEIIWLIRDVPMS
jgi:hypothetical protein